MKIIFLDCDGVINYTRWYTSEEYMNLAPDAELDIDPKVVERLNNLCYYTRAQIVISSSWKIDKYYKSRLEKAGLENIIDKTPDFVFYTGADYCRGDEIAAWLRWHDRIENYIIIDDCKDFYDDQLPHFLHINPMYGFTDDDYLVAKNMLSACVNG